MNPARELAFHATPWLVPRAGSVDGVARAMYAALRAGTSLTTDELRDMVRGGVARRAGEEAARNLARSMGFQQAAEAVAHTVSAGRTEGRSTLAHLVADVVESGETVNGIHPIEGAPPEQSEVVEGILIEAELNRSKAAPKERSECNALLARSYECVRLPERAAEAGAELVISEEGLPREVSHTLACQGVASVWGGRLAIAALGEWADSKGIARVAFGEAKEAGRALVQVCPLSGISPVTIVARGWSRGDACTVARAVEKMVKQVRKVEVTSSGDAFVAPGGGAVEAEAARELEKANCRGSKALASGLKDIARALGDSSMAFREGRDAARSALGYGLVVRGMALFPRADGSLQGRAEDPLAAGVAEPIAIAASVPPMAAEMLYMERLSKSAVPCRRLHAPPAEGEEQEERLGPF